MASQQESVEAAQKILHREKNQCVESMAIDPDQQDCLATSATSTRDIMPRKTDALVQELTKQLEQLSAEVSRLRGSRPPRPIDNRGEGSVGLRQWSDRVGAVEGKAI